MQYPHLTRRSFLRAASAGFLTPFVSRAQSRGPNIVLILADDLGYGDLGCYGSKIRTPNISRMSREGVRFRHFYSASPVCSASRAALLTGRYSARVGVPGVLFPWDDKGIPDTERTLAQLLKAQGYKTMCAGKWHLGSKPDYLPTNRGFDEYYGVPYSNDMSPLPLMQNNQVVEEQVRTDTLTVHSADQAAKFIARSKESPFFLYFAPTSPHIPLSVSEQFRGISPLGAYGDAVEELDWAVGEVLNALDSNEVRDNTLVMFLSDNGPWYQGSPGKLRGRKGDTLEGGVRVPFLARLPERIPGGLVSQAVASALDILPTVAALTGAPLPPQPLDGIDITPLLDGTQEKLEREALLYFDGVQLQCARLGRYKLHLSRYNSPAWVQSPPGGRINLPLPRPELYDVVSDEEESYDLSQRNPEIVGEIRQRVERLLETFPDEVRNAWSETMSIPVEDTPAGARPVRKPAQ